MKPVQAELGEIVMHVVCGIAGDAGMVGRRLPLALIVVPVQAIALLPVFVGQMCQFTLIAARRQSAQAIANASALVLLLVCGLVLIPLDGARGAAIAAVAGEFQEHVGKSDVPFVADITD